MPSIPMYGGAYEASSPNYSSQTCINWYPIQPRQIDMAKYSTAYYRTPGLSLFCEITGSETRGIYATINYLYAVVDNKFYQIDTDGNAIQKGTLSTSTGRVSITSNFTQIGLVDGTSTLYVYDLNSDTFSSNTIPGSDTAKRITFQDAYGIFALDGTASFQITEASDFTTMSALDVGTCTSSAAINNLVAVESSRLELWLFGTVRTEIWRNAGTTPFPYERQQVFIECGCAAPYTIETMDNSILWLGRDERGRCMVYRGDGYRPVIISTDALHEEFESFSDVSNAFSYSYTEDGHTFYVICFPNDDVTYAYDVATQLWHRRTSWDPVYYRTNRHVSNCYAFFNGNHIVGAFNSGKIYKMGRQYLDDDGDLIYRERTYPTLADDLKQMTFDEFQVDIQSGVGLDTGQGSDPKVMLRVQRNGQWGNERWKPAGKVGERNERVRWTRLGSARNWIFRIAVTDPVDWALLDTRAVFRTGTC